jgi:hypothetical protein
MLQPEVTPPAGTNTSSELTTNLTTLANWISERAQTDMQPPPQVIMTQYMQQLNGSGWCNDDWPWWIGKPPAPLNDPPLSEPQRALFIAGTGEFNQAISDVSSSPNLLPNASANLTIAMASDFSFIGHQWCSDSPLGSVFQDTPWNYTLSTTSFQAAIYAAITGGAESQAPFHPTPCGQTQFANDVGNELATKPGLSWSDPGISCPSGQP